MKYLKNVGKKNNLNEEINNIDFNYFFIDLEEFFR